ncbi:MAG: ABC transporter ATP-binding protein [Sandaracinaceae bacterium]
MIRVDNLTKRYGDHEAVRGLAFHVKRGEVCGFLGPNGAGKSTTLRMLTGFLEPTGGSIAIGGVDALAKPLEARALIGYMPEACPLYPEMRVGEYLHYRANLKRVPVEKVDERVRTSLAEAKVDDVEHRIIGQLSKGYRQRVGLADALVADPPLLILDEPTAGLDPNQIRQVRDLIKRLAKDKKDKTVLLSTHILPEVEAICDRVLILNRGKLVSDGQVGSLRDPSAASGACLEARSAVIIEGRGAAGAFQDAFETLDGVRVASLEAEGERVRATLESGDPDVAERVFRAVAEAGLVLRELRPHQASLEDVFSKLTTNEPEPSAAREEEE